MPIMSTGIEYIRHMDIICDRSVIRSPGNIIVYTIESARNIKHIPVQNQTGNVMHL